MNFSIVLSMLNNALIFSKKMNLSRLAIVVLDSRAKVQGAICDESVGTLRFDIALGKASAAIGMGFGTRQFNTLIKNGVLPEMFANCINGSAQGNFIPLPGGVLIMKKHQEVMGAVGISGASSDQDEAVAIYINKGFCCSEDQHQF